MFYAPFEPGHHAALGRIYDEDYPTIFPKIIGQSLVKWAAKLEPHGSQWFVMREAALTRRMIAGAGYHLAAQFSIEFNIDFR
jgi:hypothetical protein